MGKTDYFLLGAWNYRCDQCYEKFKSIVAVKQWDGLVVCPQCLDPRHPQDFIKAIVEKPIPWSRPDLGPCEAPTPPPEIVCGRWIDDCFVIDGTWIG